MALVLRRLNALKHAVRKSGGCRASVVDQDQEFGELTKLPPGINRKPAQALGLAAVVMLLGRADEVVNEGSLLQWKGRVVARSVSAGTSAFTESIGG
jgi:hypothetical protein